MCGISGIISWDSAVDQAEVEKMNASIIHRGPDATGVFIKNNVGFGHQRLSILDLSEDGTQPMFYKDLVLIFNGEIYNYIEIRDELKKLGRAFNTRTDSEVILHAYDQWGSDCVKKFNGMWAFAIYDQNKKEIFLSRDRFGIKPLYYKESDQGLRFGSELKQLVGNSNKVNREVMMNFLILGYEIYDENTFFDGIKCLKPSHNMFVDLEAKSFKVEKYYSIKIYPEHKLIQEKEAVELYKESFERSVELRLRSDVKVGTCLSGGLDSSFVAAVAANKYKGQGEKFQAINAGTNNPKLDESKYARIVAEASGIELHQIVPSSQKFEENLNEVIYTQEEPFSGTSAYMQYFVLEKAKELGCTVMLDGQAGDETLLGYPKYYASYLRSLPFLQKFKGVLNSSKNSNISAMRIIKMWAYFTKGNLRYKTLRKRWDIVNDEWASLASKKLILDLSEAFRNIDDLQKHELEITQLPRLLRYEDKNSMRHSVETRLPFTDYKHVELSLSLSHTLKIKDGWTKYIQRKAMDNMLPESIVWRKNKLGFESPQEEWIGNIKGQMVETIRSSELVNEILKNQDSISTMDHQRLWKLFNIAKWSEIYSVNS